MLLKCMLLAAATLGKVRPQDDFYHSVNEDWIASHPIPADKSSVGIFDGIKVEVDSQIKSIFKDLLKLPKGESLAAELYASGMDSEALEKSGISPIKAFADQIMAPKVDLETVIYLFQRNGIPSGLFNIGAESNKLNTSQVVLSLDQPSLTLPEKSYYFEDEYQEIREHAQTAIENILNASDYPVTDYKSAAKLVFEFESRLANASMSTEELDHSYTVSNMVLLSDLKALTPNFNWDSFLNKIGVNVSVVSTGNSEYLKFLFQILQGTDQSTLKLYLYYSLVKFAAPYLNGEMVESNFAFEKIFSGKKSPSSREKLVAEAVSSSLPDEISKLYVKSHFAPEEKAAALEMVQYIIESYRERITNNDWMAAETKEKAILKLNNMNVKIGYPDQWIDYSSLNGKITRDQSYFQNILIASAFDFDRRMKTVGEDTPRWEWFMSAFTVNAYNMPTANEIVFPAAILQEPTLYPPKKDEMGKPAINFGRAGSVIGHEISHSFDTSGRKFDQFGNLADWWTEKDASAFEARADSLKRQYNQYELYGVKVNGNNTITESIADFVGDIVSFDAFEKYLTAHPELPTMVDGYTQRQRFFIALAEFWSSNQRKEAVLNSLKNDPHPPPQFRVNGPFSNHPGFYKAFNITEGDELFRPVADRVVLY